MKRLLAMLLLFAMVLGLMPAGIAAEERAETPDKVLTEEDYVLADLMWEEINEQEEQLLAKRATASATIETLIDTVTASPYYAEGSLSRNGDHFFWWTVDGIACGYSPRMSSIARNADLAENTETAPTTLTYNYGTKNSPSGTAKDVYVIQPYFGIDTDFTTQYVTEAQNIAQATGGTATVYRTDDATIDNIANAIEQGAVVIFDSHGDTDYINPKNEDDCSSRANTSYICLQDGTGLTDADYAKVSGPFDAYSNAYYGGQYRDMKFYYVNGTAIANHMESTAPNSLLWMALCLGMATDGLHKPLMEKGVAVAYGYSQSVTFDYDYAWEEIFWSQMIEGHTVADSITAMKEEVGCWDWCHHYQYDTIEEARKTFSAFPIVVSAEDVYPGHGKVDALQTVQSTWTLYTKCEHENIRLCDEKPASCAEPGNIAYYCCEDCSLCWADGELTLLLTPEEILIPAAHSYEVEVIPPTCEKNGYTLYTCTVCGSFYNDEIVLTEGHIYAVAVVLPTCTENGYTINSCVSCNYNYTDQFTAPMGHSFEKGFCVICDAEDPDYTVTNPFTDVKEADYFYNPVLWAVKKNITTGMSATTFVPESPCTRGQIVTFLWRAYGSPDPTTNNNPFTDVSPETYYYKAVLWAVEMGITTGMSATTFAPEATCTRGQVATFLWRAQNKPTATGENPFSDVIAGAYYYDAVLWAVEKGVTQGTGKGKFSPDDTCTRGQIVTFLYRAMN